MLKKILLVGLLLLWNHFVQGLAPETIFAVLNEVSARHQTLLVTIALLGGGVLLALAYLLTGCGLYKIAKAAAVLTEHASLLLLLALGIGQAWLHLQLEVNLYTAGGWWLALALFFLLAAAVWAQRIIDFNHPGQQVFLHAAIAAGWPLVVIPLYNLFTAAGGG
ncbi:MAG: hypothetical protein U5J62_01520 [Desulfurivibrio sp.]|nr:hypothetical protein [Desulfurivibrio sp.]